jgi:hypothetical protein
VKDNLITKIKKWSIRFLIVALLLIGVLALFIFFPALLYTNKTVIGNYAIYHTKPLNKTLLLRLDQSDFTIKSSEIYDKELKMDICLKDGSTYPGLIENVLGRDMLQTFYNKIVFTSDSINLNDNFMMIDGHKWNMVEILAHAQVHCFEFKKLGLWNSNPISKHPRWKWEGYPEYIARQYSQISNLNDCNTMLEAAEQGKRPAWLTLPDSTEILTSYLKYKIFVQYCMEVKKMSFIHFLDDTTSEETLRQEILDWSKNSHREKNVSVVH